MQSALSAERKEAAGEVVLRVQLQGLRVGGRQG